MGKKKKGWYSLTIVRYQPFFFLLKCIIQSTNNVIFWFKYHYMVVVIEHSYKVYNNKCRYSKCEKCFKSILIYFLSKNKNWNPHYNQWPERMEIKRVSKMKPDRSPQCSCHSTPHTRYTCRIFDRTYNSKCKK